MGKGTRKKQEGKRKMEQGRRTKKTRLQAGELSKQNGDLDAEIGDLQGSVARLEDRRRRLSRYAASTCSMRMSRLLPYDLQPPCVAGGQVYRVEHDTGASPAGIMSCMLQPVTDELA